jgi:hypothetical protein
MMEAIHSSKSQFLQEPHSVTSQEMAFFIVITVKTSNITGCCEFKWKLETTGSFKLQHENAPHIAS